MDRVAYRTLGARGLHTSRALCAPGSSAARAAVPGSRLEAMRARLAEDSTITIDDFAETKRAERIQLGRINDMRPVSYTHLRAHET